MLIRHNTIIPMFAINVKMVLSGPDIIRLLKQAIKTVRYALTTYLRMCPSQPSKYF
jgi:hypothetical protein